MFKLWNLLGSIHPPAAKTAATRTRIRSAIVPKRLVMPLNQHSGSPARACVELGQRVLKGQMIGKPVDGLSLPVHASSSGSVVAIDLQPVAHPSGLAETCIVIQTDGLDQWIELAPVADYRQLSADELRERIRAAGIAGLGGAVFPTDHKLRPQQVPVQALILNGAECEPYISADDMLMRERAERVIIGGLIMAQALATPVVWLAIEDNKPEAIAALQRAAVNTPVQIRVIPTHYPSGGAKQLVQILTGLEVPQGKYPLDLGLQVHNVGTAAAVYQAIVVGEPLISRITSLAGGNWNQQRNQEVLLGTPVADLIQHQLKWSGQPLIMGGPLMGFRLLSEQVPVVKATNCLLSPEPGEWSAPGTERPCIRCGDCHTACPVDLLPQQLYWFAKAEDWQKTKQYHLSDCIECGACAYVCPSDIPLVQYYRFAKSEIQALEHKQQQSEQARLRFEARTQRLEREKQARANRPRPNLALSSPLNAQEDKHAPIAIAVQAAESLPEQKASLAPVISAEDKQAQIAAAVARVKARKAEQAALAAEPTAATAEGSAALTSEDKQAQIAAAVARVKARKAEQAALAAAQTAALPSKQDS